MLITKSHACCGAFWVAAAISSCSKVPAGPAAAAPTEPSAPVAVQTVKAEEGKVPRYLRLTGEITSARDAAVAADTTGKVVATPIERGSIVDAGDVLIKLDDRAAKLALAEAEANVALAKSRLALAESEVARNAPLAKSKAVADTEFSRIKADKEARIADLAAAEARRDMASKTLNDATIRAPFAGSVAERLVAIGEYVRSDSQVVRLVDLENLRLTINVAEPDVGKVRKGQAVQFTVSSYPGEVFKAAVEFIGAAVRGGSRDLLIEASVTTQPGKLKPGLFADARLMLPEQTAIMLPAAAVRKDGAQHKVWVVESGQLSERLVETGESSGDHVEIRRGVAKGEVVVAKPGPEVTDGLPVTVTAQLTPRR